MRHDFLSLEEVERDPITKNLTALERGWQIGTTVPMPTGDWVVFTFERWIADGRHPPKDIGALNQLLPHLSRSGMTSSRLGLARAHAAVATLEALGLPAAVLNLTGKVVASNTLLDDMQASSVPLAHGKVALACREADTLLQSALGRLAASTDPLVQSIPVRGDDRRKPVIVHVLPFRRTARDIFSGADVLLVATPIGAKRLPDQSILAGLFDLTPAEARLSSILMSGRTLQESAVDLGVSIARSERT